MGAIWFIVVLGLGALPPGSAQPTPLLVTQGISPGSMVKPRSCPGIHSLSEFWDSTWNQPSNEETSLPQMSLPG
jgi:hypothetical protein